MSLEAITQLVVVASREHIVTYEKLKTLLELLSLKLKHFASIIKVHNASLPFFQPIILIFLYPPLPLIDLIPLNQHVPLTRRPRPKFVLIDLINLL